MNKINGIRKSFKIIKENKDDSEKIRDEEVIKVFKYEEIKRDK